MLEFGPDMPEPITRQDAAAMIIQREMENIMALRENYGLHSKPTSFIPNGSQYHENIAILDTEFRGLCHYH